MAHLLWLLTVALKSKTTKKFGISLFMPVIVVVSTNYAVRYHFLARPD
jgi:hypothetical protein